MKKYNRYLPAVSQFKQYLIQNYNTLPDLCFAFEVTAAQKLELVLATLLALNQHNYCRDFNSKNLFATFFYNSKLYQVDFDGLSVYFNNKPSTLIFDEKQQFIIKQQSDQLLNGADFTKFLKKANIN